METATLTSTTPASHDLQTSSSKTLCASVGRGRVRAPIYLEYADKRNASPRVHFSQAQPEQIGLGSFCIQSRRRGNPAKFATLLPPGLGGKVNSRKGTANKCSARVIPRMLLERRRSPKFLVFEQIAGSSMLPGFLAGYGAPFSGYGAPCSAEWEGDSSTRKRMFHTLSTWPYKLNKWFQSPSRIMMAECHGRSVDFTSDDFGPYPWDPFASDNQTIEWIQEDVVTLFTTDGLIQIGGSLVPHQSSAMERKQLRGKAPVRYRRFKEEDYMDPKQGLCLGAIFDIVATNGLDMGRRLCVFGFCRSVEMLSDVVEDTVLEQGGEVVVAAKGNWGGLNEKLSMRVAVPLLWGVPPAVDTLSYAIRCGGGIVEKVSCQWEFL